MLFAVLFACSTPKPPAPKAEPAPAAVAPATTEAPEAAAPQVRARPPRILRIRLSPAHPRHTDALEVAVDAVDPRGEPVDLDYDWRINDALVPEAHGPRLSPGKFKKGDRIRVDITASSGGGETTDRSEIVTVANTVPVFKTDTRSVSTLPGTTFFAEDPDGDRITWSLEHAPSGMTISPDGTVRYQGSEDEPGGDYKVAVVASDGDGFARFEVPVTVSPGSKAAKAAAAAKGTSPKR